MCRIFSAQAGHYCNTLTLDGRGWRLPNKTELMALAADFDDVAFPNAPAGWFWTATPYTGSATTAWGVTFDKPSADPHDVTTNGRVRCVR